MLQLQLLKIYKRAVAQSYLAGGRDQLPLSLKHLSKIRIVWAATEKIWVETDILGQWQEIV